MSVEALSMLISAAGLIVAMFSGFAWVIRRTDARSDAQAARSDARADRTDARADRTDERIDRLAARMDERIDNLERTIGARFDELSREMGEVKVAVARLEGPLPRLHTR